MTHTTTRRAVVDSFDELLARPFADGVNALCWPRALEGDFDEVARCFAPDDGVVVVDVDMLRARAVFGVLCDELEDGLRLEDDVVIPLYKTQPLRSPQGRADHVEGDHVILRRTLAAIDAWLDELGASPLRKTVLAGLPVVYRLLGTLEHHHEREKLHLYTVAVPLLHGEALTKTLTELRRLVAGEQRP